VLSGTSEPSATNCSKQLEVIWKTLLVPEENTTFRTIAMTPVLYNDEVIFNTDYTINGIEAPVLFLIPQMVALNRLGMIYREIHIIMKP
jgi:hypothetical protein